MLNFQGQYQKQSFFSSRLFLLVIVLLAILTIFGLFKFVFWEKNPVANVEQTKVIEPKDPLREVIPQGASSPEAFLDQIKVKSAELEKNYSDNLTEFAQSRWKNIFQLVNKENSDFESQKIEIKESSLKQEEDGSKVFRIKYSFDAGDGIQETEDWFYLLISQKRKEALGLSGLASDVFLSENQLLANLGQKDFIHITKIEKKTEKLPK